MGNNITVEQALQVLINKGLQVNTSNPLSDFLSTLIATLIGAIFGGLVTLFVYRRLEHDKIEISNINTMYKDIVGAIFDCVATMRNIHFTLNLIKLGSTDNQDMIQNIDKDLERTCKNLLLYCEMYTIELKDNEKDMRSLILEYSQFMKDWDMYSCYYFDGTSNIDNFIDEARDINTKLYSMIDKINDHKKVNMYNKK